MADAEVGDDVYGEDPTVTELQVRVAAMFGFEAALFAPTGSMANVLALAALVGPGQEVLCESRAHILRAELGAHGALTGLTSRTWVDEQGQIDLDAIRSRGYAFQIETTYRTLRAGFEVVEVPITFADREEGHSKMSRAIVLEAIWKVPLLRLQALAGRL